MPRLRCPRCASVVEVAPGAAPLCTSCGFGSQPPAPAAAPLPAIPADALLAAPMAMPPRPAPASPPPAPAAGPAPASRRGAVVAIVVVGVLVLAGAAAAVAYFAMRGEAPQALSEAEAEARVQASLEAAAEALAGRSSDGGLRKVTIEAEPADGASGSPDDPFGAMGAMAATIEYGQDGVVRFDLHMSSGAVTVAFTMYCTPERDYMVAGGKAYASRPNVGEDSGSSCMDFEDGMGGGGGAEDEMLPIDGLESADAAITRNKDGSLHAELVDNGTQVALGIDAEGRLRTMTVTDPAEGSWSMAYDYGTRSSIAPPEDFQLLPASVALVESSQEGVHTWTVGDSPQAPPLGDFEVRVQDYSSSFGFGSDGGAGLEPAVLATFALTAGPQVDGNLTFRFTDADGDGRLTSGDSFELRDASAAAGSGEASFGFASFPYHAVLYDRVADGEVNSGFNEMPLPSWLALAGLAYAGLVLRRRR